MANEYKKMNPLSKVIFDIDFGSCEAGVDAPTDEEMMEDAIGYIEEHITFPVMLTAHKSRWDGSTGTARANDAQDCFNKLMSFDNTSLKMTMSATGRVSFHTASHDVPQGFEITQDGLVEDIADYG